jgi:diguanylate cyclase (GGDEF)-like protein
MYNPTIICIDDDPAILKSLRDQLTRHFRDEFTIELVESGEEALELLAELSADGIDIPLVICDQVMPDISGDQLLCKIHQCYPDILKILLTGMAKIEPIANAINHANLYRYISKPWDETDLSLTIREALRCYEQNQQLIDQNQTLLTINQQLTSEIEERKQAEAKLVKLAFYDSLTELPNRKLFLEQVDRSLQAIKQEPDKQEPDSQFALLVIDLDRFKVVNDSLGHSVGDQMLVAIAHRLQQCIRPTDVLARFGGDEFAILLNSITSIYEATEIAKQILTHLSMPFNVQGQPFGTSASIGILQGSVDYETSMDLLRDADTAMYYAKHNGKSRYALFQPEMYNQSLNTWHLESALQRALERNELFLHYQPIVSLKTGVIKGFEALLRWQHPERGLIPPDQFIPIAEDSGLILIIGEWVLQEACRQLQDWHQRFPQWRSLTISVNLSNKQLHELQFVETVDRILAETGLDGKFLNLELTESMLIEDTETTIYTLNQLRERHIRLSIDDFGKGYSSLSYLHRLPIDCLKVDRQFTNQLDIDPPGSTMMRVIAFMAQSLGLKTVVEGIETPSQLAHLKELNCDYGQGYYFSRPLANLDVEELFRNGPLTALRRSHPDYASERLKSTPA